MALRPQYVEALRVVSAVLSDEGWPFVIIGARVPWILLAGHTWRATRDVDAVVRTPTWGAFERLAERLKAVGFAHPETHHFVSPNGAEVDLLPYGEGVVAEDTIVWPDGTVMSTLGIEEAFRSLGRAGGCSGTQCSGCHRTSACRLEDHRLSGPPA